MMNKKISSADNHKHDLERIGKNLRRVRVQHGMTQESLSRAVGLNIRTLQRIEAGKTNILITTAMRLINALNCPADELFVIIKEGSKDD
jgi:transcriptional regulator with XRE-family HTH domain